MERPSTDEILSTKWRAIQGLIPRQWPRLTDEDVRLVGGRRDRLIHRICDRYGYTADQTEYVVDEFLSLFR